MLIRYKSILIMSQVMSSYQSSTAHLSNELKLITYMSTQYKIFIIRVWAFENVSLNACTWRTCRTNIWSTYSSKRRRRKKKKKHLKHFTEKPISPTIYLAKLGSYCLLMLLTILIFHHEPPTNLYELIPLLSFTLSNH